MPIALQGDFYPVGLCIEVPSPPKSELSRLQQNECSEENKKDRLTRNPENGECNNNRNTALAVMVIPLYNDTYYLCRSRCLDVGEMLILLPIAQE